MRKRSSRYDQPRRGDQHENSLELGRFAISPSSRAHYGAERGDSTNESQHGQTHHQKKSSPNIMEDCMTHDAPLLFETVFLPTQPSARTDPGCRGILLYQPSSTTGAMPRPGVPLSSV